MKINITDLNIDQVKEFGSVLVEATSLPDPTQTEHRVAEFTLGGVTYVIQERYNIATFTVKDQPGPRLSERAFIKSLTLSQLQDLSLLGHYPELSGEDVQDVLRGYNRQNKSM